jgi:cytochrome P450 PksS
MTPQVDFTSQEFFRDPAAGIATLRVAGPVVATRLPMIGSVWITTTYESTARVPKDSETFTLRKEGGALASLRWWMPAFVGALANNMLSMDEPDHTRLRGIVDEAFRRRAVLDMEPRIRAIADDLAGALFADAGRSLDSDRGTRGYAYDRPGRAAARADDAADDRVVCRGQEARQ